MQMLQEAVLPEESISRRIANSIRKLGYPQMRTLDCKSIGSALILSGELTSFYQVQLVLKVAAREPGIERIDSRIQIVSHDSRLPET